MYLSKFVGTHLGRKYPRGIGFFVTGPRSYLGSVVWQPRRSAPNKYFGSSLPIETESSRVEDFQPKICARDRHRCIANAVGSHK